MILFRMGVPVKVFRPTNGDHAVRVGQFGKDTNIIAIFELTT